MDRWQFGWDQLIGIGNLVVVVVAAFIGVFAVRNWREERIDQRRFELAEQYLALVYEARNVFDSVRSAFGTVGEGSTRVPQDANESEDEKRERDYNFVPIERVNQFADYFSEIAKIRPSLMAVFGENSIQPLETILDQRTRIVIAARILSRALSRTHFRTEEDDQRNLEQIEANQMIIWKGYAQAVDGDLADPVDAELEKAKIAAQEIAGHYLDDRFARRGLIDFFRVR